MEHPEFGGVPIIPGVVKIDEHTRSTSGSTKNRQRQRRIGFRLFVRHSALGITKKTCEERLVPVAPLHRYGSIGAGFEDRQPFPYFESGFYGLDQLTPVRKGGSHLRLETVGA